MSEKLFTALRRRANHRGLVIVRDAQLLDELRVDSGALATAVRELERNRYLEVLSPLPFLVLKLQKWPGSDGNAAGSGPSPYSYPKQLSNKHAMKADSYRPDELAAHDGLLHEILDVLGEDDPTSFRKAIDHYSPQVIRLALDRVRRAKSIRKNRTALFRHLLPRIAKESQPSR